MDPKVHQTQAPDLRVVIAGGGIGGLATALALSAQGIAVTVLERAPEFAEIGAGLQLAPNATRVLKRLGLLDKVLEVGVAPDRLVLASALTGDELTHLDLDDFDDRYGGQYVVAHRSDLLSILHQACLDSPLTELLPGRHVRSIDQDSDYVTVTCADGSTYTGSVLIGADGLHSTVRKLIDDSEPICSGYVAYRGAVPRELTPRPIEADDVVAFIGPGLHFVQYPLRRGALYNQVAVFRSQRFADGEEEWGTPEELDSAFSVACEHVRGALTAIQRDARWPMYDRLPIDNWRVGRAVLLGDAAHPMLQYLAQGACQALVDAATLADALRQSIDAGEDLVLGLDRYQQARIAPTAAVQRNARTWGDLWHADGLAMWIRDIYLRERPPEDHRHVDPLYYQATANGTAASDLVVPAGGGVNSLLSL